MDVILANALPDEFVGDLRSSFPDLTFHVATTPQEQMAHIKSADVFYGWPAREVFRAADRLRWIQNPGTGIDQVLGVPEIIDSDVVLTNCLGPHTTPMADHVMWMVLTLAHEGRKMHDDQRARRWEPNKYSMNQIELNGGTMGILALGGIGREVARRAHGFGMKVYAVDLQPTDPPPEVRELWGIERLDDLIGMSDWFVVTVPLTPDTKGIIDARRIGLMKPNAHMIIISRGNLVDEKALAEAIQSGRIAGAGIDATAVEPLPQESPLWGLDNVVLSPHASALTPEMYEGRRQIFKENLRRFLANEPFLYVADKSAGF
jgi:phosphoglycerate dehydrogenase-like enzyme